MHRIVGAAIILSATNWIGWSENQKHKTRLVLTKEFIGALEKMQREMSFSLRPLPEVLLSLSKETRYPVSAFFENSARYAVSPERSFAQHWSDELIKLENAMDAPSLAVLEQVGRGIGKYDEKGELSLLSSAIAQLRKYAERAEAEIREKNRLRQTIGVTAGMFLILILS